MSTPAIAPPLPPYPLLSLTGRRIRLLAFAVLGLASAMGVALWNPDWYRPVGYVQVGQVVLKCITYMAAARACLYLDHPKLRASLFALINFLSIGMFFDPRQGRRQMVFFLLAYLCMIAFHFVILRVFAKRDGWWPWLAFFSPIAALALIRYVPGLFTPIWKLVPGLSVSSPALFFVGISYMAFRLSFLVLEVRNRVVPCPDFWTYAGFAFFLPTFMVGPINPYRCHYRSLINPDRAVTPVGRSWMRILIGAAKYQFLGNLFNQLSYGGLLLDGHSHGLIDLFIAALCYHLYLYCNFSGFCDMAVGAAGLLGIHVNENFRNPLGARSVQEYWTRWHITLSSYMRDVVFSPLSKALIAQFGNRRANHAIAVAIGVVFVLVGIWHGVGWQFAIYGAIHGAGVITNHYYSVLLKKALGKERFKAYSENRWIRAAAVSATFLFVTASLFFFANDFATMGKIFNAIR